MKTKLEIILSFRLFLSDLFYFCSMDSKNKSFLFINVNGALINLSSPVVMGIVNITPDSFYAGSRKQTETEIVERVHQLRNEGATIIDIGGYSSRPHAIFVDEKEEMRRLDFALPVLFREYPEAVVSVDTFRSGIARRCIEKYGVAIINDISAGESDPEMFDTIARLKVPYIMMHMRGTPQTMMQDTHYGNVQEEVFLYFADKIEQLRARGIKDIILDPGFGFSKTTGQNYFLLNYLGNFSIFGLPLLVGFSRKAMIRNVLNCDIEDSLNGTTVLNVIALMKGANILRVHDVKAAVEAVCLFNQTKDSVP